MEPVSIAVASVALSAALAAGSKRAGRATLPKMVADKSVDDSCSLTVLTVRVRQVSLSPQLSGRKLKLRVTYNSPGNSARCDLPGPDLHAAASCVFLGQCHQAGCRVEFDLKGAGFRRATVAKAELRLPWSKFNRLGHAMLSARARLMGTGASVGWEPLGLVRFAVELQVVTKEELRQVLGQMQAEESKEGFVVGPICKGTVVDQGRTGEEAAEDEEPVAAGRLIGEGQWGGH